MALRLIDHHASYQRSVDGGNDVQVVASFRVRIILSSCGWVVVLDLLIL
jgi:hypothetical protein